MMKRNCLSSSEGSVSFVARSLGDIIDSDTQLDEVDNTPVVRTQRKSEGEQQKSKKFVRFPQQDCLLTAACLLVRIA